MSWALGFRAWQDLRRFNALPAPDRQITFYAEDGASLVHLGPLALQLTQVNGLEICYITSSPADPWLLHPPAKVKVFYIGEGAARTAFFMGLKADVMVMTMPDLERFHLKRSRQQAVHYVYVFHSIVSTHMIYRRGAFDHYDTIMCVGNHHIKEIRRTEELYGLKAKTLVEYGYSRLEGLMSARPSNFIEAMGIKNVLVAPSWGDQGLLETKGEELTRVLLDAGYNVTIRPHPMTVRRHPKVFAQINDRFSRHPGFVVQGDISTSDAFFQNDVMISDWSGAALEYAFARQRPVMFIDVPRKVNNPEYTRLGLEPLEVSIREKIGAVVSADTLSSLPARLQQLESRADDHKDRITQEREQVVFNLGKSSAVGARYIVGLLRNGSG